MKKSDKWHINGSLPLGCRDIVRRAQAESALKGKKITIEEALAVIIQEYGKR